MKSLVAIWLMFVCFSAIAQQSFSIHGTVKTESGETIAGATVFITNSKHMVATDGEGKFSFDGLQPGSYEVAIKMLGFEPFIQDVTIHDKSINLLAKLTESVTALNTVNITATRNKLSLTDRVNYLLMFTNQFIGQTVNAEKCKLLNPEVLHYEFKNRVLKVWADDFLIIENNALGYRIKYLLTNFQLDFKEDICTYDGHPFFEELKGSASQQQKWDENRRVAYLSSDRHFFKAFANNRLKEEGFIVYAVTDLVVCNTDWKYKGYSIGAPNMQNTVNAFLNSNDPGRANAIFSTYKDPNPKKRLQTAFPLADAYSLFITDKDGRKMITSTPKIIGKEPGEIDTIGLKEFYIVYTGQTESPLFYKTGVPQELFKFVDLTKKQTLHRQISRIMPLADTLTIDTYGIVMPRKSFRYANYMSWLRLADLTPFEYVAEENTDSNLK
ncbi:MAG TPA: carboxypeptidase-like regulatory domain-containing protein [Mucilaginibacter sp.]|jgi:hypothetical protein|nr:carboxypeptidase-like regulatory domain-containing protein [Mucilaginibacter sp.]